MEKRDLIPVFLLIEGGRDEFLGYLEDSRLGYQPFDLLGVALLGEGNLLMPSNEGPAFVVLEAGPEIIRVRKERQDEHVSLISGTVRPPYFEE